MFFDMFKIVLFLALSAISSSTVAGYHQAQLSHQKVTLYEDIDCSGRSLDVDTKVSKLFEWDNFAYSVAFSGVWLFYEHEFYNSGHNGSMEYRFSSSSTNTSCRNFSSNLRRKLSSFRYVGDRSNYGSNSLTWYAVTRFQGEEESTLGDLPSVELERHGSLIVTGNSSWTLYDLPNYRGDSICLFPHTKTSSSPYFVYDMQRNLDIPCNYIRSVKMGCFDAKSNAAYFVPASEGQFNGTASYEEDSDY